MVTSKGATVICNYYAFKLFYKKQNNLHGKNVRLTVTTYLQYSAMVAKISNERNLRRM